MFCEYEYKFCEAGWIFTLGKTASSGDRDRRLTLPCSRRKRRCGDRFVVAALLLQKMLQRTNKWCNEQSATHKNKRCHKLTQSYSSMRQHKGLLLQRTKIWCNEQSAVWQHKGLLPIFAICCAMLCKAAQYLSQTAHIPNMSHRMQRTKSIACIVFVYIYK